MRPIKATSLLALAVSVGCAGGEDGGAAPAAAVRDSAGVTIVSNPPPDPSRDILGSPVPIVQVGVVVGDERDQLFRVSDVKRLADGGFAVANAGTRELRIYNADGSHRATAGGEGGGPSEFRFPQAIVILPGDTIQVQDDLDRVRFTSSGAFVDRVGQEVQPLADAATSLGGRPEGGTWLADGSYFAPVYDPEPAEWRPGPMLRPQMTLARLTPSLSGAEVLGRFGGIQQQFVDLAGVVSPVVPPFRAETTWDFDGAGTVVVADNARSAVHRFHADGTHSIIRWQADPTPMTSEEFEAWKEFGRSWRSPERLPEVERRWAAMDLPEFKAYYRRANVGTDGTVWVTMTDLHEIETVLMAFGSDGIYRGSVSIPGPGWFDVHDSGADWLAGIAYDENQVEFLRVYELR